MRKKNKRQPQKPSRNPPGTIIVSETYENGSVRRFAADDQWWDENIDYFLKPKIRFTISAWSDLLAYGDCLDAIKWDLTQYEKHYKTIRRLDSFREWFSISKITSAVHFILNDGLGMTQDIFEEPPYWPGLWHVIIRHIRRHHEFNLRDQNNGFAGVRTVFAAGQRLVDAAWLEGYSSKPKGEDIERVKSTGVRKFKKVKPGQGRACIYKPREFQMNLAIAKAYTLDKKGKKAGLSGPNIFFDDSIVQFMKLRSDGGSRSKPDCYNNRIKFYKQGKGLLVALEEKYYKKYRSLCSLMLDPHVRNLKVPWGKTNVYKVSKITNYRLTLFGKEVINLRYT